MLQDIQDLSRLHCGVRIDFLNKYTPPKSGKIGSIGAAEVQELALDGKHRELFKRFVPSQLREDSLGFERLMYSYRDPDFQGRQHTYMRISGHTRVRVLLQPEENGETVEVLPTDYLQCGLKSKAVFIDLAKKPVNMYGHGGNIKIFVVVPAHLVTRGSNLHYVWVFDINTDTKAVTRAHFSLDSHEEVMDEKWKYQLSSDSVKSVIVQLMLDQAGQIQLQTTFGTTEYHLTRRIERSLNLELRKDLLSCTECRYVKQLTQKKLMMLRERSYIYNCPVCSRWG